MRVPLYFGPTPIAAYGWIPSWPDIEPPKEPEAGFNLKPPTSREEADARVQFVNEHLTRGEKHQLYQLFHTVERIRLEDCNWRIAEMRDGFKTKKA